MEIWKASRLHPGYEVSNQGRIRGTARTITKRDGTSHPVPARMVKGTVSNHGYTRVYFKRDGKRRALLLHILIAYEFVENPLNLPIVNHLDGNKLNNLPGNMEWSTHQENAIHAHNTGLIKVRIPVIAIGNGLGFWFPSSVAASRDLGVSKPCICAALKGKQATAGRYRWEYALGQQ